MGRGPTPDLAAIVSDAERTYVSSADIRGLVARWSGTDLRPALFAATDAMNEQATTVLLFAMSSAGERIDGEVVERAVPWVDSLSTALAAVGSCVEDPIPAVARVCDGASLSDERLVGLLFAATRRSKGRPPVEIRRLLRIASRRQLGIEASYVLAFAALNVEDDPELHEALSPWITVVRNLRRAAVIPKSLGGTIDGGLAALLREAKRVVEPPPGGSIPPAHVGIGRNDPCPCGSGKKFKRCCASADPARSTAPPARLPEFDPAPYLALPLAEFGDLRPGTLVRLPPAAMRDEQLESARATLASFGRFDEADRMVEERLRRSPEPADERAADRVDDLIADHVDDLFRAGEGERARGWIARAPRSESLVRECAPELLFEGKDVSALDEADALVRRHLDPDVELHVGAEAVDLAFVLLRRWPALGIVFARGVIERERDLDAYALLHEIELARARLLLPLRDPAHDLCEFLFEPPDVPIDEADDDDDDESGEEIDGDPPAREVATDRIDRERYEVLRREARASGRRVVRLEDELRERERELARLKRREEGADPAAAAGRGAGERDAAEAEMSRLREKVKALKGLIREGNETRAELRRRLDRQRVDAGRREEPAEGGASSAPADRDAGAGAVHPLRRLRFDAGAEKAIRRAPAGVGRRAMERAGALAGGAAAAWRDAKPLRSVEGRWSVRVGIHHRLLFVLDDPEEGLVRVIDLVPREGLDTAVRTGRP